MENIKKKCNFSLPQDVFITLQTIKYRQKKSKKNTRFLSNNFVDKDMTLPKQKSV